MCRFSVTLENASNAISITPCTALFATELTVLDVTAAAGGTPWRWKKRTAIAMVAMLVGRARFM